MPRGYYLGQGLIPLGEHSSDDEEGPCELPNGRIVCGPHGLVVCHRCCSDYSFMDEILSDDEMNEADEESDLVLQDILGGEKRRGTGRVFPTRFHPTRSMPPMDLFCELVTTSHGIPEVRSWNVPSQLEWLGELGLRPDSNNCVCRYTLPSDPTMVLMITDGACLNNGQANPKAGWAFIHGKNGSTPAIASDRLESQGPFGDDGIQSSNRAELRAVLAALRFRAWHGEGFTTVVIATDSEYVVEGSTKWVKSWVRRDWKTAGNADVKNRDLWELLLGECEKASERGLSMQFWRIPREWNTIADAAAKEAASKESPAEQWMDVLGFAGN